MMDYNGWILIAIGHLSDSIKRPKNVNEISQKESQRTLFKIVENSLRHRLQIMARV